MRRFWIAGLALLAPVLVACTSYGEPSKGFIDPLLMQVYIPLYHDNGFSHRAAAATMVAPNIAVTNDHNLDFIPAAHVLVRSHDYDLLFFRTDVSLMPVIGRPHVGDEAIAYGQGADQSLREASGKVLGFDPAVPVDASKRPPQPAFVYAAKGGPGFSGGPVVDAKTGAILGVTFAYWDAKDGTYMYAYDIGLVMAEMHRLLDTAAMRPSP